MTIHERGKAIARVGPKLSCEQFGGIRKRVPSLTVEVQRVENVMLQERAKALLYWLFELNGLVSSFGRELVRQLDLPLPRNTIVSLSMTSQEGEQYAVSVLDGLMLAFHTQLPVLRTCTLILLGSLLTSGGKEFEFVFGKSLCRLFRVLVQQYTVGITAYGDTLLSLGRVLYRRGSGELLVTLIKEHALLDRCKNYTLLVMILFAFASTPFFKKSFLPLLLLIPSPHSSSYIAK